jgi:uncharacterized protein (TIGR00251 family)
MNGGGGRSFLKYIQPTSDGVILRVRVQPRSSKSGITGVVEDCLKVSVNAPAAEGAANRACREMLAKTFDIAKGRVEIVSGKKSREKRILLKGVDEASISPRISEILDSVC